MGKAGHIKSKLNTDIEMPNPVEWQKENAALTKPIQKMWKERLHDFIFSSYHSAIFFVVGLVGVITTIILVIVLIFGDVKRVKNTVAQDNFGMIKVSPGKAAIVDLDYHFSLFSATSHYQPMPLLQRLQVPKS